MGNAFASVTGLLLHHAESVDPTLWEWISDKIDDIFGLSAVSIVVVLGIVTLAFPIGLMALALRRARRSRVRRT
ncbi:MAG: hypothetical protein HOC77_06720 [Chloroflexi bacterium]|nr:hypothetical protein [Chloroflexota bacterium]MBT4073386.1 hypothetical protein [Chloroflexota bacterium]MBT4514769.1 hypothetical protein [Chloroflexota bacterium]MBT5320513.1 hypothetical protein [Chloroflexota bacterium]MBT6681065.1 hypothetical protein [Chloroflexota bacterium]